MPIVKHGTYRKKQIRLRDYDYAAPGAYFVTFRARPGAPRLSQIIDGEVILTACGIAVREVWRELPQHYPNMRCDEFVIMPDHVHCIVVLGEARAGFKPAATNWLG